MPDAAERRIRETLGRLAAQRAATVLQPGNVWVVEHALTVDNEMTRADLATCQMRGWITVLHDAVPSKSLNSDGSLPKDGLAFDRREPIWSLTQAGWSVVDGTNRTAVLAMTFSALSVAISLVSIALTLFTPK
jgi:hypothetical protein